MIIGTAKITIHLPWVSSLKEKRMSVKSLCSKTRAKFNVSIAEVESQDIHQLIVLGVACVVNETSVADSMIEHAVNFIERSTEGEIIDIFRELR